MVGRSVMLVRFGPMMPVACGTLRSVWHDGHCGFVPARKSCRPASGFPGTLGAGVNMGAANVFSEGTRGVGLGAGPASVHAVSPTRAAAPSPMPSGVQTLFTSVRPRATSLKAPLRLGAVRVGPGPRQDVCALHQLGWPWLEQEAFDACVPVMHQTAVRMQTAVHSTPTAHVGAGRRSAASPRCVAPDRGLPVRYGRL